MMFNNPYDFGIKRGLESFSQLVDMGYEFDARLLELEQRSQDAFVPLDEFSQLGHTTLSDEGQRASAIRFGNSRIMAVLASLNRFGFVATPLTNKALRTTVAELLTVSPEQYTQSQMSYDLRCLRLKGLIVRIPNSHRYQLTSIGIRVSAFYTKLYERIFKPGLSALSPDQNLPSDLAQALDSLGIIIRNSLDSASLCQLNT